MKQKRWKWVCVCPLQFNTKVLVLYPWSHEECNFMLPGAHETVTTPEHKAENWLTQSDTHWQRDWHPGHFRGSRTKNMAAWAINNTIWWPSDQSIYHPSPFFLPLSSRTVGQVTLLHILLCTGICGNLNKSNCVKNSTWRKWPCLVIFLFL